jgi:hypothetical protein
LQTRVEELEAREKDTNVPIEGEEKEPQRASSGKN